MLLLIYRRKTNNSTVSRLVLVYRSPHSFFGPLRAGGKTQQRAKRAQANVDGKDTRDYERTLRICERSSWHEARKALQLLYTMVWCSLCSENKDGKKKKKHDEQGRPVNPCSPFFISPLSSFCDEAKWWSNRHSDTIFIGSKVVPMRS